MMPQPVVEILESFKQGITLNGREAVFEECKQLSSEHLVKKAKPEEYTKLNLIRPVLDYFECKVDSAERIYVGPRRKERQIDYTFITKNGTKYILEAKHVNRDLFEDKDDGAVNQIVDAMKLHDVTKEFSMGVATDGLRWVFIDADRKTVADLDLQEDFETLEKVLRDELKPEYDKEAISKKFYEWYTALIYGGKYHDHEGRLRGISERECLRESIRNVVNVEAREAIAQTIMDRFIFIKFLESKRIIKDSVIEYMASLPDDRINGEMKSLFFQVMNTERKGRVTVSLPFQDIPYLNGSLFIRNSAESTNTDYWVTPMIMREIFRFLNSFSFTNKTGDTVQTLDPEILGYIFEMSMISRDRKGSGSFYTPREITAYMSKEAIHQAFVSNVRSYLKSEGYPENEQNQIQTVDDVYTKLRDITLGNVFSEVLLRLKVCDNACGSGAFLLAAADVLFDIYYNVNAKSGLSNSDVALKKLILANNIYGVDLNSSAVEIAKLRMWLWVVDSYKADYVEALPNIDYNVRSGDSLIGYVSIGEMTSTTITMDDYGINQSSVKDLLKEKELLINKYRSQSGNDARVLKIKIDDISRRIAGKLSMLIYGTYSRDIKCTTMEFFELTPFHWGLEFSEVFKQGGFDVVIGNPPYIHLENLKDGLAYQYYEKGKFRTFESKGDIYTLFYERSNALLKDQGILSYITSNSWMKARYGKSVREYFVKYTEPISIIDLADLKIFKSATVEANILSYRSIKEKKDRSSVTISSCTLSDDSVLCDIESYYEANCTNSTYNTSEVWTVSTPVVEKIMGAMKSSGKPLKDYGYQIRYGIKSGLKEAFILDSARKDAIISCDSNSSKIIKPILNGRDLEKYYHRESKQWIIMSGFEQHDMIQKEYPLVYQHLVQYESQLKKRGQCKGKQKEGKNYTGQHHWLELDNNPSEEYIDAITGTKIAWIDLSDRGRFTIVEAGTVVSDTCFFINVDNPAFILGILNSTPASWYFQNICATSGAGTNRWKKQYVEQIPIPLNPSNEAIIEQLARHLMQNPSDGDVFRQLDHEVCRAYGLSQEEMEYVLDSGMERCSQNASLCIP